MGRKTDAKRVEPSVERKCSVCGMPLTGEINFCGYCGAKIELSDAPCEKNVKSHKTPVIFRILLIILLVVGCAAAFWQRERIASQIELLLSSVRTFSQKEAPLQDGEEAGAEEGTVDTDTVNTDTVDTDTVDTDAIDADIDDDESGSEANGDESEVADSENEESSEDVASSEHMETIYFLSIETEVYSGGSESGAWTSYWYDENGNQIRINQFSAEGELLYYCVRTYDTDGNCLLENGYSAGGTKEDQVLYTLNRDGSVVSASYQDGNGIVYYQIDYTYDEQGNPTGEYYYEGGTELSYQYEYLFLNGQFISYRKYDSDGEFLEMGEYTYDDLGRQAVSRFYDADGSISGWVEFEYNEDSELVSGTRFYYADGTLSYRIESDYDENGNMISEKYFDADDGILLWLTREYVSMEISVTDN